MRGGREDGDRERRLEGGITLDRVKGRCGRQREVLGEKEEEEELRRM